MLLHPGVTITGQDTQELLQNDGFCDLLLGVLFWPDPASVEVLQDGDRSWWESLWMEPQWT